MSFKTFIEKPISDKVILVEFGISESNKFYINEEPGIWQYEYYISKETTSNFENGLFCYGCFENECSGLFENGKAKIELISILVEGESYVEATTMANLRSTNKSFYWDGKIIHVHFDFFEPPWSFTSIVLGLQINISQKEGFYNGKQYYSRIASISPIAMSIDPMYFGFIKYTGTTIKIVNDDGNYDGLKALEAYGQTVKILYGENNADYADFSLRLKGLISDFSISFNTLRLNVKDIRSGFSKTISKSYFDNVTYPHIGTNNKDKAIPVAYGVLGKIPIVCTNEDETSPADYQFKICETMYHGIKSIDKVYVEEVEKTPTSTNLNDATFKLATSDYTPGNNVMADIKGYAYGVDLIENALIILKDIVENYCDITYSSDSYDILEWFESQAIAPDIHYYSDGTKKVSDAIARICASLNGLYFVKTNGKFTFRYYDTKRAIKHNVLTEEIIKNPSISYPSKNYLTTAIVDYSQKYDTDENCFTYKDDTVEQSMQNRFGISKRYTIKSLLNNLGDATELATKLINEYALIAQMIEVEVPVKHMTLELLDYINVNLNRASKNWFGKIYLQVIGTNQNLMDGTVGLVLRGKGEDEYFEKDLTKKTQLYNEKLYNDILYEGTVA